MSNPPSASYSGQPDSTATVRSYTPTINITRDDYEAALAKWSAQQIYEYEIEVKHAALLGVNGTLHVIGDQVGEYTVNGLFDQVNTILTHGLCTATGVWAFPVAYTVSFDPDKGYPTLISRRAHEPPEWEQEGMGSSAPAHSSYSISVQNLKVIRISVQGTPISGPPEK